MEPTRKKVRRKAIQVTQLAGRIPGRTYSQLNKVITMFIKSYVGYYAQGTILTENDCSAIITARIEAIRNSRHAPAHPRLQVYTKTNKEE